MSWTLVNCLLLASVSTGALATSYYMLPQGKLLADLEPANSIAYPICEKECGGALGGGDGYGHWSYAPFTFGYTVRDSEHGAVQSREEHADGHGSVKGSYSYIDPHGIKRVVDYVADKGGFRAMIKVSLSHFHLLIISSNLLFFQTNEPGTKTSNPADAVYMSSAPQMSPHDEYMSMESPKQAVLINDGGHALGGLGLGLGLGGDMGGRGSDGGKGGY